MVTATAYRVEMWFVSDHEGMSEEPGRMPDVNVVVQAKTADRAKRAAYHKANRAAQGWRWWDLDIAECNVFAEGGQS